MFGLFLLLNCLMIISHPVLGCVARRAINLNLRVLSVAAVCRRFDWPVHKEKHIFLAFIN